VQARNVAISSAITSAYAPDSRNALFRIGIFWRHSLAVAFRSAELAASSRKLAVPSAFTAGILHNMGRLAMFHADPAGMDQAVALAIAEGLTLEEAEEQSLDYSHSELGGALAMRWRLPAEIVTAIARHHAVEPTEASLAGVVAQADRFCQENGILPGYVIPPPEGEEAPPVPDDMARILKQVDGLMEMVMGDPVGVITAA
jgi:putative nucleotidyltransferase with HDIG domain